LDQDSQLVERAIGGEGGGGIAEGVLVLIEPAVRRHVDAPVHDEFAVVVARGEPPHLDHAAGRAAVSIGRPVRGAEQHGTAASSRWGAPCPWGLRAISTGGAGGEPSMPMRNKCIASVELSGKRMSSQSDCGEAAPWRNRIGGRCEALTASV